MPGYPALAENRSGTWRQSQVGHTVPSTSTVPRPTTSRGSGTPSARASPISGRSRSQWRLTVAWLTPNGASEVLGHVLAHQAHHQGHRPEQPQRERWTGGDELVTTQLASAIQRDLEVGVS